MILKLGNLVSCSSEHSSNPALNLLNYRPGSAEKSTWLCSKPGIVESEAIFELSEPGQISGVDIGNCRCCTVRISGATSERPEEWVEIVSHEFMTRNEADDGRFKDQVKLFTKKEIGEEISTLTFERVKITCEQPANLKVLFGLAFLVLRAEDKVENGELDAFGRFKVKGKKDDSLDKFKEKYLQQIRPKAANFKAQLAKQIETSRAIAAVEKQAEETTLRKRPSLRRSESPNRLDGTTKCDGNPKTVKAEDEPPVKKSKLDEKDVRKDSKRSPKAAFSSVQRKTTSILSKDNSLRGRSRCSLCLGNEENVLCKTCNLLLPEKKKEEEPPKPKVSKPKKLAKKFDALFEGVVFSLSGYKNPERNIIRGKAIAMGAKYVADTNHRNHGCTHLICAFKNTPKYGQLKGRAKITNHRWIEECYDKKTRFPWRRYALDDDDKIDPESEDEIKVESDRSGVYDQDTDSD